MDDILKKMREAYLAKNNPGNIRDGALRYMRTGPDQSITAIADEFRTASKLEALQGAAKAQQYYDQNFKPGGKSEMPPEDELNNLYLKLLLSDKNK